MPVNYIPFIPEPVEGQAVLGNFNRILRYRGVDESAVNLRRGMPLYEMERQETVGENTAGNMVIRGECVSACAYLKEQGIQVDLVYIDPPFASGADYARQVYIRRHPKAAAALAQAERVMDFEDLRSFEDKMYGDVWDKEKYLNWMYENLMAIRSVMSEKASIYVHLDWHIGHYVKILLDEVFGEDNFRNEIVWCYTGPGSPGMRQFNRKHDIIFWYSKGEEYHFFDQNIRVAHDEKTKENFKRGLEGSGFLSDNYDLDAKGKIPEDWWQFAIAGRFPVDGVKRVDYATEKPWALLERVIKASSSEDMLVADFFGGSGVTAAVANRLGRRFIHCDVGVNSVQTARDRLKADGAAFDVMEIKDGVQIYRNPVQTMDKIRSLIPGLCKEASLDAFWAGAIADSRLGMIPVYLPNLLDSSSRVLDSVLMNRVIHQAIPELDPSVKKVIVYYIDITSREEICSFIAQDDSTAVEIELRDLKSILDDVVIGDYAEFRCQSAAGDSTGWMVVVDRFASDRVWSRIVEFNRKAAHNARKTFQPVEISEDGLELIELLSLDCTADAGEWHADSEIKIDRLGYVIRNGKRTNGFWDGTIQSKTRPLRLKIRNICGDETVWQVV